MANLTRRWSWKKWAPDIGENLEGEEPLLFLELATGLTGKQLADMRAELNKARELQPPKPAVPEGATAQEIEALFEGAMAEYLAAVRAIEAPALAPYVRVFEGPHTVDGQPLGTVDDYLKLVQQGADFGVRARMELGAALHRYNSLEGPDELFSRRSSGGARTTGRTAKTAAR